MEKTIAVLVICPATLLLCCSAPGKSSAPDLSDGVETVTDSISVHDGADGQQTDILIDLAIPDLAPKVICTGPLNCPEALAPYCEGVTASHTAVPEVLSYYIDGDTYFLDLSSMGGQWQPGDLEVTSFDPEHPFVLDSVQVFMRQAGPVELHLWGDYGGSWPDQDQNLVEPVTLESPGEGWLTWKLDEPLELHPHQRIWVGFVHDESDQSIAIDQGDPFLLNPDLASWANTSHTRVRSQWYVEQMRSQGGFQWISSPYTHFMELVGHIICPLNQREFTDVSLAALGGPVYATRLSWGDLNGDGYDDFMIHNNRYPGEPKERVFYNLSDGTFADWSVESNLTGRSSNLVTFADTDNDGDEDALLSVYYNIETTSDPQWVDTLMLNDGEGHFAPHEAAGVANGSTTASVAFADYDGDGWLDHYAGNTRHHGPDKNYDQAMKDQLFHNDGDGTFSEVTDTAGMVEQPSSYYPLHPEYFTLTNGVIWTDFDNDGDSDLYVANYGLSANFMWQNLGNGTFDNVAVQCNLDGDDRDGLSAEGTSFGAHWADYDNDGDMDLFQTEISHPRYHQWGSDRSSLRQNLGGDPPYFEIVTEKAGIVWDEGDYEASWLDYDNDGLQDLYISSVYGLHYSRLYRQNTDHTFTDWTYRAGVRLMNAKSHAWADFDRDGDLDLLVGSRQPGVTMHLFRNDVGQNNSWLSVRLEGTTDNRDGIGARVEVTDELSIVQVREVRAGGGHTRQDSLPVEFGLGSREAPVQLTVRWPSGAVSEYPTVETCRFVLVKQGQAQIEYLD